MTKMYVQVRVSVRAVLALIPFPGVHRAITCYLDLPQVCRNPSINRYIGAAHVVATDALNKCLSWRDLKFSRSWRVAPTSTPTKPAKVDVLLRVRRGVLFYRAVHNLRFNWALEIHIRLVV